MARFAVGITVLTLACFLVTPFSGCLLLEWLASVYPPISVASCPPADAIAVLSGGGPPRHRPLKPWESPNRIEAGLALYRAGRAPLLLLTAKGENGEGWRKEVGLDTPADDVLVAGPARNTADEASWIAAAARQRNWRRLVLVTSGYHMGRAMLLVANAARQAGISLTVIPFPADPLIYERWPQGARRFLPGIAGWEYSSRAVRETVGQLAGRVGF